MRKRSALLLAGALVVSLAVVPAGATGKCAPDRYFMYEHANYGGHGRGECVSNPDLRNVEWGPWAWEDYDDMISSVKAVTWVYFYDGYNYNSLIAAYGGNTNIPNVGAADDNKFSSVWNGFQ